MCVKILADSGVHQTFEFVFLRGVIMFVMSSLKIYFDAIRDAGTGPAVFGDSAFVKWMLFLRAVAGFGGYAFALLGEYNHGGTLQISP